MDIEKINRSIDAVLETPYSIKITNKLEGYPENIVLTPSTPYTFFKINKLMNELPDLGEIHPLVGKRFHNDHIKLVTENKDKVLDIICIAWWNKKGNYDPKYKEILLHGAKDMKELLLIFYEVVMRLGYSDFTSTTILMKKMGLWSAKEIIASQKMMKKSIIQ